MSEEAQPKPVSFHYHYYRQSGQPFGHSSYMVIVSDEALLGLAKDDPMRFLALRFNGCATPARRVIALGQILHDAEKRGQSGDETAPKKPSLFRRFAVFCIHLLTR